MRQKRVLQKPSMGPTHVLDIGGGLTTQELTADIKFACRNLEMRSL